MNPLFESNLLQTRRQFFGHSGLRLGGLGLTYAIGSGAFAASKTQVHEPLPGLPHFAAKAKAVIYLHMNGGPSQLDTWDYKPELQKRHGHWVIVVCGGDGLRQAYALVHTGMTADMATALAKKLNVAESRLPADTLKQFASFEGMLRVDGDAGHGAGHGGQGVQHKH